MGHRNNRQYHPFFLLTYFITKTQLDQDLDNHKTKQAMTNEQTVSG